MAPVLTRSVDYERFLYDAGGQAELSVTEYWAVLLYCIRLVNL